MIKICKNCKENFKTYKSGQIYCTRECSANSQKISKVRKECEFSGCTNIFEIYENGKNGKRFCSTSCQHNWQRISQLGSNNGNYGRENKWGTHNKEKRKEISDKIKKSWENPKRLKKHLEFLNSRRLPDGSFDFQDELFRDRISKANIKRLMDSPEYGAYKNCKRGWYKSIKTGDDEYFHSSWEENKMIELDKDSKINFWTKKHGFVIEYNHLGVKKRYLPDFLIENDKILEVKGYVKDIEKFKLKCEAALKYFHKININYDVDFMKNEKKYEKLLNWFKMKKKEYYE